MTLYNYSAPNSIVFKTAEEEKPTFLLKPPNFFFFQQNTSLSGFWAVRFKMLLYPDLFYQSECLPKSSNTCVHPLQVCICLLSSISMNALYRLSTLQQNGEPQHMLGLCAHQSSRVLDHNCSSPTRSYHVPFLHLPHGCLILFWAYADTHKT